ncbi:TIGR00730 family Rossman fold protein [Ramlibacter sp. AW1]|uniref:Cytokinin riboside 5'-monophosphate phosphoribohydrolase n=1 Tax=Ramlibacter aurantiacus TaxID=2801330 RepID=A0A936ZHY3_9BURK|nr:TIGR00730 family Rossman fold protein [Ramlibacter aurantiacus]MBL0420553.1 TIGR00730 family Rossman fold protein [Ramlibacter aurantiacus]
MNPTFSICVYCGSRDGVAAPYFDAARAVGQWIGQRGGQLVYGGGNRGLMGAAASATLQAGGRVVGVIPQGLVDRELAKRDCDELHIVSSMHERKTMMAERADAFLALPGGIGTFEEFFEVWTWRQLGYHDKPVGLLDVNGYYAPLHAFLQSSVKAGFMNADQMELIRIGSDLPAMLEGLVRQSRRSSGREDLSKT